MNNKYIASFLTFFAFNLMIFSSCMTSSYHLMWEKESTISIDIDGVLLDVGLAYCDNQQKWRPISMYQEGDYYLSKGDVDLSFFLTKNDLPYYSYELEIKSKMDIRVALFITSSKAGWDKDLFHLLPGLLFGDNNLDNVRSPQSFHHLTNKSGGGKAFSPIWEFRADRAAMPLSAMAGGGECVAISIDPYVEISETTSVANGLLSILSTLNQPAFCGVTVGYANYPYHYPYQGAFLPMKEQRLSSGKVSGRIYAKSSSDRRSINQFVREEYKYRRSLPVAKNSKTTSLIAAAKALGESHWSETDKAFCNLYFQNGVTDSKDAHKRILKEIGWCGGPSIALPAMQAGLYFNDEKLLEQAMVTCNQIPKLYNPLSGLLYDNGMTGDKSVDGWWSGRSGFNRHWAYTNGSCISDLMSCATLLESYNKKVPTSWDDISIKVLDTIAQLQMADGNLGFSYSTDHKEILDDHGCIGAWWIPGFALASKRLNRPDYMQAAKKAIVYYHQFYKALDVNGASMDTGKSPNEESAHAFIRASRIMHELTGDEYYLETLRDGIDLECLWRYGYKTKPLVSPLSSSNWNSCGGSVTSVANPCIHPMGIRISDDMRYYATVTGDQYVFQRWEDGIFWSMASLELYPSKTGFGPYGISSERYAQSDGMLYPSSHEEGLSSIWSASHCFGVAAIVEGLVDAVKTKPFSYKGVLKDK